MTFIANHVCQSNLQAACELAFQGLKILQAVPIWGDNFGGQPLHLTCVKGLPSLFSIPWGSLQRGPYKKTKGQYSTSIVLRKQELVNKRFIT